GRAPFANEKSPTKREGGQSLQGELFDETLETWRRQFSVGELMEVLPSSVRRSFSRLGVPQKKQETLVTEALEQALRFSQSPYGREVLRSSNYCFEFPFLFHLPLSPSEEKGPFQSILVRGSMDLIYETEEGCSIIDFKTDKEILPELHRVQLECYRLGAPAFSDKPVRCFLYYLRHHEIREMTDPLAPEVLFKLAQETLKKTGSMGLMEEPLVFMSEGEGGF
ncbi:MAG: PD-(D/E)XK nuclease family protein, partial [Breznakiellaceae bacterium]